MSAVAPRADGQVLRRQVLHDKTKKAWSGIARHPIAAPFVLALGVRAVAAAGIAALEHRYLFPDESAYVRFGRAAAAGHLTRRVDGGYGEALFHSAASFMWPVTVLFQVFGAHELVAALWAALFGAVTAALTAGLVRLVLSTSWALGAGLAVAVFPSQVLWSSVVLRESMVWTALAATALGTAAFARAERWQAIVGATVLVGVSLLGLAYLRTWTFVAAAWAVALAVWLFRPARPAVARAVCLALCVVVPIVPALGPAGIDYVSHDVQLLSYERSVLARGASSAFVPPLALSDEDLNIPDGIGNDIRAFPRGLVAFALRPFPWQHGGGLSYDLAALEELFYYPLYLLAAVGLFAYRRRRQVIAFPLIAAVLVTGVAAEAEGNLGTAFRHRDQLLWAMVLFAALGAHHLYQRWCARRPEPSSATTA